jgi:2-polyprenyl-3-methyl-5-hydroxy-6-metoxy-1,4-benzoquinol methylase
LSLLSQSIQHTDVSPNAASAVACPYCQSLSLHFLSSTDRNRHTTDQVFEYFCCEGCGLIFMKSPPKDMSPYYRGGYDPIPVTAAELRQIAAGEKYRTEPVLKYKSSGRCLEIGPWRGVICSNMKDAGFEVTAIEMDAACVSFLREKLGVEAIPSIDPADSMRQLRPGFDVIISWHSLEHLPRPWTVIEQASRLLSPGGILVLAMPNPDSYEFSRLKARWYHLDAPRHLQLFPLKTLVNICQANQLTPLEITTSDRFSQIQSRQAWYDLGRSVVPVPFLNRLAGAIAGRLLPRLTHQKQMTEGLGSAYTAIFARE